MGSHSNGGRVVALLRQELAPYPGRLAGTLRDTLGIVLALIAAMTLRVPGIALALALLFLMQRERPGLTLRVSLQIFLGAAVACAACLLWVQATDGSGVARLLGIVLGIFVASFCMVATAKPLFWTIFAFYGFVDLAGWDTHRAADAIVTTSLDNLASLAIVVACAVLVEYLFGTRHPAEDLRQEMQKRATALARFFAALAQESPERGSTQFRALHNALVQYAHAGDLYLNELCVRVWDSSHGLSTVPLAIQYRIGLITRVIEKSVLLGFHSLHQEGPEDRNAYLAIADLCASFEEPGAAENVRELPPSVPAPLREIMVELQQYAATLRAADSHLPLPGPATPPPAPESGPAFQLFLPGVFDSSYAVFYALKLTLAATVCYVVYNAIAWPGILTCVITVLFTGLSSTGAMKQKQLYRFSGAAIGGVLGIATVALLYPNMDSITSLVVVVAAIAMLSAWVLRCPRISYVGVQIGFAFFLTALPGFRATTQIAPARDRVIGVALGILVMWFIFDQLWPTRTSDALTRVLLSIGKATSRLAAARQSASGRLEKFAFERLRAGVAAHFEAGRQRKRELARSRRLIRQIEFSAAEFYRLARQVSAD